MRSSHTLMKVWASATDIITYVGNPPWLFLAFFPLSILSLILLITTYHIRKAIGKNGLDADTRSSLLSGIFEVALPRYSVIPLDREDDAYRELNSAASTVLGRSLSGTGLSPVRNHTGYGIVTNYKSHRQKFTLKKYWISCEIEERY